MIHSPGSGGVLGSLRLPKLPEGLLYNPGNGDPVTFIPSGTAGQILTDRGPGLKPAWQLPQEIQAFVTGSSLAANPALANPAARFNAIDPADGIKEYSAVVPAPPISFRGVAYGQGWYVLVATDGGVYIGTELDDLNLVYSAGAALADVIYDDYTGKFWAVGASGTMISSSNGWSWGTVSRPVEVAADNLTGIATDGAGVFVVSNSSSGERALYSTDGGSVFSGIGAGKITGATYCVHYAGGYFVLGRSSGTSRLWSYAPASDLVSGWSSGSASLSGGTTINSITSDGTNVIFGGTNGFVQTIPVGVLPNTASSTIRSSGTTEDLSLFTANGYVYAVGSNGVSLVSTGNGEIWQPGPPVGVTSFLRAGMADPADPRRAIVVGDNGVILEGKYPFRASVYDNATDRSNRANELGEAFYAYSNTPLKVEIAGQITYQTGIIGIGDVPLEFDVITIADIIFATFATNNPSLSPGPFRCFNAYYDFGDGKWKFGPESVSNYAFLELYDSTSGTLYVKVSTAAGAAGEEITWKDLYSIDKDGGVTFESLKGSGSRTVMVDANGKLSAP